MCVCLPFAISLRLPSPPVDEPVRRHHHQQQETTTHPTWTTLHRRRNVILDDPVVPVAEALHDLVGDNRRTAASPARHGFKMF